MTTTGCPPPTELWGFVTGTLPRPAFERVANHVERCAACDTHLQRFDGPADPLQVQLRQPPAAGVPPDTVSPALLRALQSTRPGAGGPWSGADRPRRLGKFELLEELGIGSFGHVFRARDTELDRLVAIKILRAGRLAG